jgi:hypothetical protein
MDGKANLLCRDQVFRVLHMHVAGVAAPADPFCC